MHKDSYFKTKMVERPYKENELRYIVRAEYQSEQSKISDFGYADVESTKSKSPYKIMNIARNEALERVYFPRGRYIPLGCHLNLKRTTCGHCHCNDLKVEHMKKAALKCV